MTLRRMKTYPGEQGYVYQYYFVGKRAATEKGQGTEYIFDVTSDRKTKYAVSVFLGEELLRQWASRHGRPLNDAEQYGAVKMRLFRAFDEIEDMMAKGRSLTLDAMQLEEVLKTLGVD